MTFPIIKKFQNFLICNWAVNKMRQEKSLNDMIIFISMAAKLSSFDDCPFASLSPSIIPNKDFQTGPPQPTHKFLLEFNLSYNV